MGEGTLRRMLAGFGALRGSPGGIPHGGIVGALLLHFLTVCQQPYVL